MIISLLEKLIERILTLIWKPNIEYYRTIKEFKEKLPRSQKRAKKLVGEELNRLPLSDDMKSVTILDLSPQRISLQESDLDMFFNRLEHLDTKLIFFKKYYRQYTANLKRFNPAATHKNFDLAVMQLVLDEKRKPIHPWKVFEFHLMWKYKFSSRIYLGSSFCRAESLDTWFESSLGHKR